MPRTNRAFPQLFISIAVIVTLSRGTALAHARSMSYSTWDIRGRGAHVTVRLSELDLSRFPWAATADRERVLATYLTATLRLMASDSTCSVSDGPRALEAPPGRVIYEWNLGCPATGALRIESTLLFDVAPSHLHFARVALDGSRVMDRVLSDAERSWPLTDTSATAKPQPRGTSVVGYLELGVGHIWTGYDHMAFLLALLLIGTSLLEVAEVVTGFTVGHSITLALAVLGYVRPERSPIEALIGLSIALVAAENVWLISGRGRVLPWIVGGVLACLALVAARGYGRVPGLTLAGLALFSLCYLGLVERVARPAVLRWAIAFIFGLIHGFGFAAVLVEAHLTAERLLQGLFGFNLGVEVGQLAVVAMIWPLLRWVSNRGRLGGVVVEVGSAAVFALGVFWFVTRAYG
jgi:HupE/UreJ protein